MPVFTAWQTDRLPAERTTVHGPRILFIGEGVSLAHVGRPAVLARWAREAGCDVHFACSSRCAAIARAEGFEPLPVPTIDPKHFYARLAQGKFFYTTDELEGYVQAELKLFDELRPDLVVSDFRLSVDISTTLVGIPMLSLINAYWSPASLASFPAPNAGLLGLLPRALRHRVFDLIRPLAFRFFARPLDQARRHFGLDACSDFRSHYSAGRWCAYLDLPEICPVASPPTGHFFLGPIPWRPSGQVRPALGTLGLRRTLAYVSLGSTGDGRILPNVVSALLGLNCDLVLSGVRAEQTAELRQTITDFDKHAVVAPLFDPRDVLQRARLTVCHGGSGTIYQSLAAGVPVLSLPGNPDQALASAAVSARGAGLVVDATNSTIEQLTASATALLGTSSFGQQAQTLARLIAQHDTHRHWLEFLNSSLPQASDTPVPAPIVAATFAAKEELVIAPDR